MTANDLPPDVAAAIERYGAACEEVEAHIRVVFSLPPLWEGFDIDVDVDITPERQRSRRERLVRWLRNLL